MTKQHVFVSLILALVFTMFVITTIDAQPTTVSVEAVDCTVEIIDPGREWIDEDNVYHLRGKVARKIKYSDYALMNGIDIIEINLNLDLNDGSGDGFGYGIFQPEGVEDGWFRGRWTGEFNGGVLTGQSISHGTGTLRPLMGESTFGPITDPSEAPYPCWEPMRLVAEITDPLGGNLE